jgi:HSP20 family protein
MNLPTRSNPLIQLSRLNPFSEMEDLLRSFGRRSSYTREFENAMDMRLDVNEDDVAYTVDIDIPGVRKEDIDVSVEGNQISIRAEVNRELSQGKGKELYSERYSGQAFRSFALPLEVDAAKAKAAYDGGVLRLTLPKKAGSSVKRLPIN